VAHTGARLVKRRQALRERNLPRNGQPKTHPDDERERWPEGSAPHRRIDFPMPQKLIKKAAAQRPSCDCARTQPAADSPEPSAAACGCRLLLAPFVPFPSLAAVNRNFLLWPNRNFSLWRDRLRRPSFPSAFRIVTITGCFSALWTWLARVMLRDRAEGPNMPGRLKLRAFRAQHVLSPLHANA
jgi:hypothetical protein